MSAIGFDSTAMAWAAAVNEYEERSMNSAMKSYRKGVINGNKGKDPGRLSEEDLDLPQDDYSFSFGDNSEDGTDEFSTEPGIIDLQDGMFFKFFVKANLEQWVQIRFYLKPYYYNSMDDTPGSYWQSIAKDIPTVVVTKSDGVVNEYRLLTNAGNTQHNYVYSWAKDGSSWSKRVITRYQLVIQAGRIYVRCYYTLTGSSYDEPLTGYTSVGAGDLSVHDPDNPYSSHTASQYGGCSTQDMT